MDDATLAALRVAASAGVDIGFATAVGALATAALLRGAASAWGATCVRRAWGLCGLACAAALGASLAWIWIEAISMTELAPGAALRAIGDIAVDTRFGHAWAIAMLAWTTCATCAALAWRHQRRGQVLILAFHETQESRPDPRTASIAAACIALVVAAVAHASAGHAGANGFGISTVVIAVHLLAIGAWAGAVFAAVLVVAPGRVDPAEALRYASRLSSLATMALVLVLVTGALAAWHGLGGSLAPLSPRTGSTWGLVLDAKLAGVALAIALGGFNRVVTLPALRSATGQDASWRRFARVLRVEAVVMLAVLVAAALLGNGEPPAV